MGAFVTHGYRRTQVHDIADALGLAKGTLYGYAANKEALFAAAIRYGDGLEPLPDVSALPMHPPADGEMAELMAGRLAAEVPNLALARSGAIGCHTPPTRPVPSCPASSSTSSSGCLAIASPSSASTVVRPSCRSSAKSGPKTGRGEQMSRMGAYLDSRQRAGLLAVPGPIDLVARTTVELCVLWGVHCHFDPAPLASTSTYDDPTVATALAAMITRSMTPARRCLMPVSIRRVEVAVATRNIVRTKATDQWAVANTTEIRPPPSPAERRHGPRP